MGGSNVLAAYRLYGGRLPPNSMNALAYMSAVSLDSDAEPSFWKGHAAIAADCLGRPKFTKADQRAVERTVTPLHAIGAITVTRHSWGAVEGTGETVRYRLNLITPDRHPTESVGRRHPTESDEAPDEKRRAMSTRTSRTPNPNSSAVGGCTKHPNKKHNRCRDCGTAGRPKCDTEGQRRHSERCRAGDSRNCTWRHCECACHPVTRTEGERS